MNTVSNTAPRQGIFCVQFNRALLHHYIQTDSSPSVLAVCTLEFLDAVEMYSEAVYFKNQDVYQGKLHVSWHYSQVIFCLSLLLFWFSL
jgi:hypothetical protein